MCISSHVSICTISLILVAREVRRFLNSHARFSNLYTNEVLPIVVACSNFNRSFLVKYRRHMAEKLPKRRETLSNQSINQSKKI